MFFIIASFLIFYLFHRRLILKSSKDAEGVREAINVLSSSLEKKNKIAEYLPSKQKKASFLFELSQELIELDDPESIFGFFLSAAEQLFADFNFISLFEFDRKTHRPQLIRSLKKKNIPIKEKQGGEIERWMMRQNSSILIGDIRKDFRFDSNQIDGHIERNSLSFLASPLSVGSDFFGIIRIESNKENFFSHEDLRLLSNISDLVAVVLERAKLLKRVEELAVTDSLTSLFLRNYFTQKFNSELERTKEAESNLGLLMLDVDDFKEINDSHGHMVGDLVLKKIAAILKQLEPDSRVTVSRYGGEEFMVLVADTGKKELIKIAQKLRENISNSTVVYRRNKVSFTVSIGLVLYPDDKVDFEGIFDQADKLMYKAKKEGKDRICYLP